MNFTTHTTQKLTDQFGRTHQYLRISLIERCNLRCFYCMPAEGIELTEKANLMTHEEVIDLAKTFVELGINKIRLTGGEPLIKKNIEKIIVELAQLPISLGITTNGILLDKYHNLLWENGVRDVNISLDTLNREKFNTITRRDYFDRVLKNIELFVQSGFNVKINVVLMKHVNDNEIVDFIAFTKNKNIAIRFIEFMPFDGNQWDTKKVVSLASIIQQAEEHYTPDHLVKLKDKPHDTAKNYRIKGHQGTFGIISTVTHPFCDSCNRLRLTANGRIKNCLFSEAESDLLTALRQGKDVKEILLKNVFNKKKARGGMVADTDFFDSQKNTKNRAMISIGG